MYNKWLQKDISENQISKIKAKVLPLFNVGPVLKIA